MHAPTASKVWLVLVSVVLGLAWARPSLGLQAEEPAHQPSDQRAVVLDVARPIGPGTAEFITQAHAPA